MWLIKIILIIYIIIVIGIFLLIFYVIPFSLFFYSRKPFKFVDEFMDNVFSFIIDKHKQYGY